MWHSLLQGAASGIELHGRGYDAQLSWQKSFIRAGRVIAVIIRPDTDAYSAVIVEGAVGSAEAILADHGHHYLGEFPSASAAADAAERYIAEMPEKRCQCTDISAQSALDPSP
jgi:hypothetical protein